jgi:hypothetical protein
MVLKRPAKKVTLTFAVVSLRGLWVNGMLKLYTFIFVLKGCTFVGLWYGSKETREESDFDICNSQSARILGQWDA